MWLKRVAQVCFFTGVAGVGTMIVLVNVMGFFAYLTIVGIFLMICYLVVNEG
jgi:hypothetical protein